METLFKLGSLAVLPFWALMIFLPRWRVTKRLMSSPLVCAAPAVIYAALVIPRFAEVWQAILSPELSGVAALLGSPVGATIAWLHFLAFDLFVGRWIYLDGRERGVSGWVMAPVLFLTLMLGPCGFLLHLMVRRTRGYLQASENVIPVSTGSK
jgi:apolipoprotein N-acyltransferase